MVRRIVNTGKTLPRVDPKVLVDALRAEGLTVEEVRHEAPSRRISQETFVATLKAEGFEVEEVEVRYCPNPHSFDTRHLFRANRARK